MKRLLLIFIGMVVLLSAHATGYETINGLKYLIDTDAQVATLVADTVKYSGDVVVPEKVTLSGIDYPVVAFAKDCFRGCTSLTSITIPSSVTSFGDRCFLNCNSIASIIIPSSVTSLGESCFSYCTSLISITIPSSVTSLGDYCFSECSSLTSISIPPSVTSLGVFCFNSCSSLTSITIPSSVRQVGYYCFIGCNNLVSVYCYAENPPSAESQGQPSTTILYVPAASVDKYKQADGWKDFIAILPISGTEGDVKGKCEKPVITYADGKLHFESSTTGAEYHYTLDCGDVKSGAYSKDGSVSLAAAYNITAYATADGYTPSDNATATLYWVNGILETTNINVAKMRGVLASSQDGIVTISGLGNDEMVSLYTVDGKVIGEATAVDGVASYAVGNIPIVIAKVGTSSIKIAVK